MNEPDTDREAGFRHSITLLLAVLILLPSLWGFGSKFIEFLALVRGEVDGAFAVTPIVNYLAASLGFLCLFGWAVANGMFYDIERPKQTMLENEARLDAVSGREETGQQQEGCDS